MSRVYFYQNNRQEIPFLDWLQIMKQKNHSIYHKTCQILLSMEEDTIQLVRPNYKKTPICRTGYNNLYKVRLGNYRALFLVDNHRYFLLHAFVKKTQKTKEKEFQLASRELASRSFINGDKLKNMTN